MAGSALAGLLTLLYCVRIFSAASLWPNSCAARDTTIKFALSSAVSPKLKDACLKADFDGWRRYAQPGDALDFWAHAPPETESTKLVAIVNGPSGPEIYFPRGRAFLHKLGCVNDQDGRCDGRFGAMIAIFRDAFAAGLQIPDVAWIHNVGDTPVCPARDGGEPACRLPVLSYRKRAGDGDILVPPPPSNALRPVDADMIAPASGAAELGSVARRVPWRCKRDAVALPPQWPCAEGGGFGECAEHPAESVTADGGSFVGGVPAQERATYKFALAADDGAEGSLSELLMVDSVAVKPRSEWLVWYQRALTPDLHFVQAHSNSSADVRSAVASLQARGGLAREIAANGIAFGVENLTASARLAYWKLVLAQLSELFDNMALIVQTLKASHLRDVIRDPVMKEVDPKQEAPLPWHELFWR